VNQQRQDLKNSVDVLEVPVRGQTSTQLNNCLLHQNKGCFQTGLINVSTLAIKNNAFKILSIENR